MSENISVEFIHFTLTKFPLNFYPKLRQSLVKLMMNGLYFKNIIANDRKESSLYIFLYHTFKLDNVRSQIAKFCPTKSLIKAKNRISLNTVPSTAAICSANNS